MTASTIARLKSAVPACIALAVTACGGGGGGGGGAPPAAPALIDSGNAATVTREVIDAGIGAGAFGVAVGGGGILAGDGGASALALGRAGQRRAALQAGASIPIPAETFDCAVSGTVRLSGTLASIDTVTAGDRINATFSDCDDAEGAVYDGGLRIDVTRFSGDIFSNQFLLGADITLTNLTITEDGESVTGDGGFDLDLDLTVPLVSDLTVSGSVFDVSSGSNGWVLRDFAISILEDATGVDLLTRYSGTGTLEGSGFDGAVDFVTVDPLESTGGDYPATGELLITGANGATIRATVLDASTIQLALDLDGNGVVDETQEMQWSTVGTLGSVSYCLCGPVLPPVTPGP